MMKHIKTLFPFLVVLLFSQINAQNNIKLDYGFIRFEVPDTWTYPEPYEQIRYEQFSIDMGAVVCEVSILGSDYLKAKTLADEISMPETELTNTFSTDQFVFDYYVKGTREYWLYDDGYYGLVIYNQDCPDEVPLEDMIKSIEFDKHVYEWKTYKRKDIGLSFDVPEIWEIDGFKSKFRKGPCMSIQVREDLFIAIYDLLDSEEARKMFAEKPGELSEYKTEHFNIQKKIDSDESFRYYLAENEGKAFYIELFYEMGDEHNYKIIDDFFERIKICEQ